jgi:hypothetical protein
MSDKTEVLSQIVVVMKDYWDVPADCNDGELFTYAEILLDRIRAGEDQQTLYLYLAAVQVEKLRMPKSDAYRDIVDGSILFVRESG